MIKKRKIKKCPRCHTHLSTERSSLLCTEPLRLLPNFFHVSAAPFLKSVDVLKCSLQ